MKEQPPPIKSPNTLITAHPASLSYAPPAPHTAPAAPPEIQGQKNFTINTSRYSLYLIEALHFFRPHKQSAEPRSERR